MKKYCKITAFLLCLILMSTLFSGCKAIGAISDITDGDGFTLGGEDGGFAVGDDLPWPSDKMNDLPAPKAKFGGVLSGTDPVSCVVTFSDLSADDAEDYKQTLIDLGYESSLDMTNSDGFMFAGNMPDGSGVSFIYNTSSQDGTISFSEQADTASGEETGGNSEISNEETIAETIAETEADVNETTGIAEPVDMTDEGEWPADFLPGVPELDGKITDVMSMNNQYVYISMEYINENDLKDYIAKLKNNGYTVDPSEVTSADSIVYSANNAAGDNVSVYFGKNDDNNTAEITLTKAGE